MELKRLWQNEKLLMGLKVEKGDIHSCTLLHDAMASDATIPLFPLTWLIQCCFCFRHAKEDKNNSNAKDRDSDDCHLLI